MSESKKYTITGNFTNYGDSITVNNGETINVNGI